jgi:hypothetical protein
MSRRASVGAGRAALAVFASLVVVGSASAAPSNDNFADSQPVGCATPAATGTNAEASREPGEPLHFPGTEGGASVWYSWTPAESGRTTFDTIGSTFDTVLSVYTGSSLGSLTRVASGDDGADGPFDLRSRVSFVAAAATTYHIAVDGHDAGDVGNVTLNCARTPPPNDDFFDAVWRPWSRGTFFGDNLLATRQVGEPLATGGRGATVWYAWQAPASGPVRFDTAGSDLDTVIAVYTGAAVDSLSLVAADDDSAGGGASRLFFEAFQGELYYVAVDSKEGTAGRFALNFVQQLTPPPANDDFAQAEVVTGMQGEIQGSNVSATKEQGEPLHFPASDWGGASVWYRWSAPADGTLVLRIDDGFALNALVAVYSGASLGTLTPLGREGGSRPFELRVRVESGGSYSIAVDGAGITAPKTGSFALSWELFEPPPNDDFAAAEELAGESGTLSASNAGATTEAGEPDPQGEQGGASVWYRWTAPTTQTMRLDVYDDGFGSLLDVYTGETVGALTPVAGEFTSTWMHSKMTFDAVAGTEYRIAVDGGSGDIGEFTLRWKPAGPANDDFLDAEAIAQLRTQRVVSNAWATKEEGEPAHAGQAGGASVWYRWTPPTPGTLTLDTDGSTVPTLLALYTGDTLADLREVASDDSLDGSATIRLEADGSRLWIAVDSVGGTAGTLSLNLDFRPAHDDFADAEIINGVFGSGWLGILGATSQASEPPHAGVAAERSVWWRWMAPATGTAVFRAWAGTGSRFAAYRGTTLATLVPLDSDSVPDGQGDPRYDPGFLDVRFKAVEGTTYHFALDGTPYLAGQVAIASEMLPEPPVASIPAGTRIAAGAVPVRLAWSGPAGDGIEHFDLQQLDGSDWVDVVSPTAVRITRPLQPASGYRFRVRAAAEGDASAWVPGSEFALTAYQESSPKIAYRGIWKRGSSASAYGGAVKHTRDRGASAKLSATARSLAVVAPKGPASGKAAILIDGKLVKVVDLYASSFRPRMVVFARNWTLAQRHTITLRALATRNHRSSGIRVALDAIITIR